MKSNFELPYILSCICKYYQVEKSEIEKHCRKKHLIIPRQMYFYFASEFSVYGLDKMAKLINRDHATAVYSINKIKIEKEIYSQIKIDIKEIESMLHASIIPFEVDLLQLSINYTKSFLLYQNA